MRIEFDRAGNAAYVYLASGSRHEPVRQHVVDEPHTRGLVVLDFDKKSQLASR